MLSPKKSPAYLCLDVLKKVEKEGNQIRGDGVKTRPRLEGRGTWFDAKTLAGEGTASVTSLRKDAKGGGTPFTRLRGVQRARGPEGGGREALSRKKKLNFTLGGYGKGRA